LSFAGLRDGLRAYLGVAGGIEVPLVLESRSTLLKARLGGFMGRALAAGDREHGASVHFVTPELDGGPVVLQARVPVLPGDDEDTLAARVLRQEHIIYPRVVGWFATGRLVLRDDAVYLDGRRIDAPLLLDAVTEENA
jgi:hypothetical protein